VFCSRKGAGEYAVKKLYRFAADLIRSDLTGSENLSNPAQAQTASGQWRIGIIQIIQRFAGK